MNKEEEYMEYLHTAKTTKQIMEHFCAKENAVWQVMRTLRLKKLAHRIQDGNESYWKITEDDDDVPQIPVTSLQMKYLEYLRTPHTTNEMVAHFGKTVCAVQQVTRTLRLMGYVRSVGIGSQKGSSGCWFLWESTDEGVEAMGN